MQQESVFLFFDSALHFLVFCCTVLLFPIYPIELVSKNLYNQNKKFVKYTIFVVLKEGNRMNRSEQKVIVYFADWHLQEPTSSFHGEVAELPWEKVSFVNHAFWYVEPSEMPNVSSFERRASGLAPRTEFRIVSLHPELDLENCEESSLVPGLPKNHFAQYAYFAKKYPDVSILLSIGGWTRCGFFSEMAYTREGRASFIASCLDQMKQYPWIGGIDIDWEYPAGTLDGERAADASDPDDQGCPIWGTANEDSRNFTALLAELRTAMDRAYGSGAKKLTACASGSIARTLPCQDWKSAADSLDLINIMTYDLAGVWDGITGHASSAAQSEACAAYFQQLGVPSSKLCLGSPLYATPFRMTQISTLPSGSPVVAQRPITDTIDQQMLEQWSRDAVEGYSIRSENGRYSISNSFCNDSLGWHLCYDNENGSPYLYNDDAASAYFNWFLSFENALSLQRKLDYISQNKLGGIIVWEASQDTGSNRLIAQMYDQLNAKE